MPLKVTSATRGASRLTRTVAAPPIRACRAGASAGSNLARTIDADRLAQAATTSALAPHATHGPRRHATTTATIIKKAAGHH